MSAIQPYDTDELLRQLTEAHTALSQSDRAPSERTLTARNYGSAINALIQYLNAEGSPVPTRAMLEKWRADMVDGRLTQAGGKPFSVKTVNARLSAARKLLRTVADNTTDINIKTVLRDWAQIGDAPEVIVQDKIEEDFGRRLKLASLQALVAAMPTNNLKGLRDRAIIALASGAGLRVSEVVSLRMKDVFGTENKNGQRGIRIRRGKHHKARIVVVNGWNSWILQAVRAYTDAIGLDQEANAEEYVIRGVKPLKGGRYRSEGTHLSARNAQAIFDEPRGYQAEYEGQMVYINFHDLRRTFAKLCKMSGMSWEALKRQMGHSSVVITERYVGSETDWNERVPNWKIELE